MGKKRSVVGKVINNNNILLLLLLIIKHMFEDLEFTNPGKERIG